MTSNRFKFSRVNEITGLFVLAAVGLLVVITVLRGHTQRWFAPKFTFEVLMPEEGAQGLSEGRGVFIKGIAAGVVDEIKIGDNGRISAQVSIRDNLARFVSVDSIAVMKKTFGVGGDSFLEVTTGTGSPLAALGTIPCPPAEGMTDRLESILNDIRREIVPVVKKAGDVLDKAGVAFEKFGVAGDKIGDASQKLGGTVDEFQKLAAGLNDPNQHLQQILVRMDKLAAGLEKGEGSAGKLLHETEMMDGLQKVIADSQTRMEELKPVLANLRRATEKLPDVSNTLAKELPGTLREAQKTMTELTRLVEGIQRHWLFRKYMDKDDSVPSDSPPATPPQQSRFLRDLFKSKEP